MSDGLSYWDFPEGSDEYIWRRDKALRPWAFEEAARIYATYWKPLLKKQPEGPTLVTNTYTQDWANWHAVDTDTHCQKQNDDIQGNRRDMEHLKSLLLRDDSDNAEISREMNTKKRHSALNRKSWTM